jgi:predicted RNA-binding protein with PIN domain
MQYVVDGHNLIPKVALDLASPDDELDLIQLLQQFSRTTRSKVEVFFDGAPAGQAGTRRVGLVMAHFVRSGRTADSAIRAWLQDLHQAARGWAVVSSDREVQLAAKDAGAKVVSAEAFARLLRDENRRHRRTHKGSTAKEGGSLARDEVQEWLDLFRKPS